MISVFDENIEVFLAKFKEKKEEIFQEIDDFFENQNFSKSCHFKNNAIKILSKLPNQTKQLNRNLFIKYDQIANFIYLTDEESSFTLTINYIKKINIDDYENEEKKTNYIVSKYYYHKLFDKKIVKYKLKNSSQTNTIDSYNVNNVIFNNELDCLIVHSNYQSIYKKIFDILKKESQYKEISPKEFYNEYRILNFPEIDSNIIELMEWKEIIFLLEQDIKQINILYYNMKIGLSVYLQRILIAKTRTNIRYFYCNVNYLYFETSKKNIQNYLFFYLSKLYSFDKLEQYSQFMENYVFRIIHNYIGQKGELIKNILNLIYQHFDEVHLIFDNIKNESEFDTIINYLDSQSIKGYIYIYIQLNSKTLNLCSRYSELIKDLRLDFILEPQNFEDSLDNYIYSLKKITQSKIIEKYSQKIKNFFQDYNCENYCLLLKFKYLISSNYYLGLNLLKEISQFLPLIFVNLEINKKFKIYFRNDSIKEIFNNNYVGYVYKLRNNEKLKSIFPQVSKSEEGLNLVHQIIYDIITSNSNVLIIKLKRIFSINSFPIFNYDKKKNILFIQIDSNSPYYDFCFLIQNEGLNILKAYQIGINKGKDDLEKLNINFLLFDLYYFCQKLEIEKQIKTDKIELGLITTYNAYKEYLNKEKKFYPNFENMKKFCENNSFEFLIFNTNDSNFYKFNGNNLENTDIIKNSKYQYDVIKIFNNENIFKESNKINYYFKIEKKTDKNDKNDKNKIIIGKIKFPINLKINKKDINNYFEYTAFSEKESITIEFYGNKKENDNNNNKEIEIEEDEIEVNEVKEKEKEEEKEEEKNKKEEEEDNDVKSNNLIEEDDKCPNNGYLGKKRK